MSNRDKKYDDAWILYQSGMSLDQVAAQTGVSRQAVYFAFKKRGYQLRSKTLLPYIEIMGKRFTLHYSGYYRMTTGRREVASNYVWRKLVGPIPRGYCVIHIDRNPANNHIDNLECVPRSPLGDMALRLRDALFGNDDSAFSVELQAWREKIKADCSPVPGFIPEVLKKRIQRKLTALAVEAVHWRQEYKEACPDVGWGESWEKSAEKIAEASGVPIDIGELLRAYELKYGKE